MVDHIKISKDFNFSKAFVAISKMFSSVDLYLREVQIYEKSIVKFLIREGAHFKGHFTSFVPSKHFLFPLKTLENHKVFWCFQGVEKGWTRNKWIYGTFALGLFRKDTIIWQLHLLPMVVIYFNPIQPNVVGITPWWKQLQLEYNCILVKELHKSLHVTVSKFARNSKYVL